MYAALAQSIPIARTRWLALGGIIGPVLFVSLVVINGFLWEGYSHTAQPISELGGPVAPYPLLQSANFIILGLLVIGFARALAVLVPGSGKAALLVAVFGVSSCIANGLLPCDEGCVGETTVGQLHNITGLLGFLAAIVGMLLLARQWLRLPESRSLGVFSLSAAAVAIAGLAAFIAADATGADGFGLFQRVFVGALLFWIAVVAARLLRLESPGDPL